MGSSVAPAAAGSSSNNSGAEVVALHNVDRGRRALPGRPVAVLQLPAVARTGFLGPRLRLSLPSFRWVAGWVCVLHSLCTQPHLVPQQHVLCVAAAELCVLGCWGASAAGAATSWVHSASIAPRLRS